MHIDYTCLNNGFDLCFSHCIGEWWQFDSAGHRTGGQRSVQLPCSQRPGRSTSHHTPARARWGRFYKSIVRNSEWCHDILTSRMSLFEAWLNWACRNIRTLQNIRYMNMCNFFCVFSNVCTFNGLLTKSCAAIIYTCIYILEQAGQMLKLLPLPRTAGRFNALYLVQCHILVFIWPVLAA